MRTEDPKNVERANSVLKLIESGKTLKSAATKRGWPAISMRAVINRHPELRARFETASIKNGKARNLNVTGVKKPAKKVIPKAKPKKVTPKKVTPAPVQVTPAATETPLTA